MSGVTDEEVRGIWNWLVKKKINVNMPNPGDWRLDIHKDDYSEEEAARLAREFKIMLIIYFLCVKGLDYSPNVSFRLI